MARNKFGAKFPIMEKCEVNGEECHDVWKWLRVNSELYNKKKQKTNEIPWNFSKFLVNKEGKVLKYFNPMIGPLETKSDIEHYLQTLS